MFSFIANEWEVFQDTLQVSQTSVSHLENRTVGSCLGALVILTGYEL